MCACPLVKEIGADFYVGNAHKWLGSARGCGFVYAGPNSNGSELTLRPSIVSHGYGHGLLSDFLWDGNRDYGAALALPCALRFHRWINGLSGAAEASANPAAQQLGTSARHGRELVAAASALLETRWDTGRALPFAPDLADGLAMRLVPLPTTALAKAKAHVSNEPIGPHVSDASVVQGWLHSTHGIEVPVKSVRGKLYVRLSAHAYNELADYQRLADAIRP